MLPLAIPLDCGGVLPAILSPILGIPGAPLLSAVRAGLPVFRVRGKFLPSIIGAAAPLAIRLTASRLTRLKLRWQEASLTVTASPFHHTGGCRTEAGRFSCAEEFRSCCRVDTASPPMAHSGTTKLAEMLSFYPGADIFIPASAEQTSPEAAFLLHFRGRSRCGRLVGNRDSGPTRLRRQVGRLPRIRFSWVKVAPGEKDATRGIKRMVLMYTYPPQGNA